MRKTEVAMQFMHGEENLNVVLCETNVLSIVKLKANNEGKFQQIGCSTTPMLIMATQKSKQSNKHSLQFRTKFSNNNKKHEINIAHNCSYEGAIATRARLTSYEGQQDKQQYL